MLVLPPSECEIFFLLHYNSGTSNACMACMHVRAFWSNWLLLFNDLPTLATSSQSSRPTGRAPVTP